MGWGAVSNMLPYSLIPSFLVPQFYVSCPCFDSDLCRRYWLIGQFDWSVWLVSLTGQFDWSVWLVSLIGQFDWSIWLVSLIDQFDWSVWLVSLIDQFDWSVWLVVWLVSLIGQFDWSVWLVSLIGSLIGQLCKFTLSWLLLLSLFHWFVRSQDPLYDNYRYKRSFGTPSNQIVSIPSNMPGAMVDRHGNLVVRAVD